MRFRTAVPARAAFRGQDYWRKPVPGFGDARARIVVVGLAPAAHGGNRTGRVFTGDESAKFLMRSLHEAGLASKPTSLSRDDDLVLTYCYITAAVKCVPPDDRPTQKEFRSCSLYLHAELELLSQVEAIVALGHLAFESIMDWAASRGAETSGLKFQHGREYGFERLPTVYACYHPSPRNTYTGKLTQRMMTGLFRRVIKESPSEQKTILLIKTEKTVYDEREESDGRRVLVMRFWPRGVSKDKVDVWLKDLGTEKELIKRWKAGTMTWSEFTWAYNSSLKGKEETLKELAAESRTRTITLLCGCRDEVHCHRHLLKRAVEQYT